MAAIFQIRRGTTDISSSIVDGELYLHKGKNSLQVSIGDGNPITLLPLNTSSFGDINLIGDISASNIFVSGNLHISGNLILGNSGSDTISAIGEFTSNLIPNPTNTHDIGSLTKRWNTVHATSFSGSFSGSINGINEGILAFSTSVDSRLDSVESYTASVSTSVGLLQATASYLNTTFSSSVNGRLNSIESYTASVSTSVGLLQATASYLNTTFSTSVDIRLDGLEIESESFKTFTGSIFYPFTSSTNSRLGDIELYTSSLRTAIDVTGGNTRIIGNLIVDGTQTSLNTTETFIEDKSITLASGSTTSAIADGAGFNIAGAGVSMSWEDTNQRLYFNTNIAVLGSISSSTIVGLNGESVNAYSISVDSRINSNSSSIGALSSSAYSLSSSFDTRITNNSSSIGALSSSAYSLSSSFDTRITNNSSSIDALSSSVYIVSGSLASKFTALETISASHISSIGQINSVTQSLHSYTQSVNTLIGGIDSKLLALENVSSSHSSSIGQINSVIVSLNSWTGSGFFNSYSTSVDFLLDELRYDLDLLTPAGLSASFNNLNSFTTSANSRLNNIEAATSSYETTGRGIVSGSSQIISALPTGVISGSSQITLILPTGVVSGSSQITYTDISSIPAGIVSGSSQVTEILSSLNTFTASNDNTSLNSYTSSLKGAITISGTDVSIAGGLTVLGTTTIIDSTVVNINDNIIQLNGAGVTNAGIVVRDATGTTTSGSLLWDSTNDYWKAGALGSESKLLRVDGDNVVSSSSQILGGTGIVSGSSQITFSGISSLPTLVSGSSQITYVNISSIPAGIVSSSSQITYVNISSIPAGIVSGSSQITYASIGSIPAGIVSGSSQITLSSTTGGDTSANVQFGSLGIGTTASGVSGEIRATGDITAFYSSDIRLKENIQPIQNALEKVKSISGNTYDWKEGYEELHSHKGNDVGVIAQEIEQILPQIVTNRDNGYKAVQYEKIIPLLIQAIKELSTKIDILENK